MCEDETDWLSLKPTEPSPAQCCGSGCSPCVFDIYQSDLERWEKAKELGDTSLLSRRKVENSGSVLNSETFTAFRLILVERETDDTNRYRFHLPNGSSLGHMLGQHIVFRGIVKGLEIQRAYTPISRLDTRGHFDVLIKIYEHGLMSQFITGWKEGDWIECRGPFGGFSYRPNQYGELVMLCSGTGIAPMLPILSSVTDNEDDETFITLVICCRTYEKLYLKSFLHEQARFWNVRIFYVLSQEKSLGNLPMSYQENTKIGRMDPNFMANMLKTCRRESYILICGSLTFNEDMREMLKQLGKTDSSLFIF
ncbi:NADH-cytochrome b5 reductase-like isoform X1 [Pelobates cultripes]|uniref:NADH-cytochrome b5 reductase-like isoform X1 n=1 Tax=Pelobates cultripes TaxID=61616 RepID=A0AAD1WK82_PELCU|nr:NADH-cytochrome b5 reductase-like isoform X1 [Pelobates cultripes]